MTLDDSVFAAPAQDIGEIIKQFGLDGGMVFFPQLPKLAMSLATMTLLWWGVKTVVTRDASVLSKNFIPFLLIVTSVAQLMATPMLVFEWLIWPVEDLFVRASEALMARFSPAGYVAPPDELNSYARLMWNVEMMIQWVIMLSAQLVTDARWWNGEIIYRLFAAIILGAPYFFIGTLHMLYMAEAAFVFALVGILSPMVIVAYIFPAGRQYAHTLLRLMLAAGLTVFIAICAISLTGSVIKDTAPEIQRMIDPSNSPAVADAKAEVEQACRARKGFSPDPVKCTEARERLNDVEEPSLHLLGPTFLRVVAVGFLSMLLHLKAVTLASNIAGVQGGPGAAAGVAGLATAAVGTGFGLSKFAAAKGVEAGSKVGKAAWAKAPSWSSSSSSSSPSPEGGSAQLGGGDPLRGAPVSPVYPAHASGGIDPLGKLGDVKLDQGNPGQDAPGKKIGGREAVSGDGLRKPGKT